MDEKEMKKRFKEKAKKEYKKYYPVNFLKSRGYIRKICKSCGSAFWTLDEKREVCDDPTCIGGYSFIGKQNTIQKLDFIASWQLFKKVFKRLGYTPIARYPVVARWREDMDFVIASIADFQPYVVSGEVDPPANPLIVPQFCLRFNDIDNVGFTGRHYTGFVMIGQHTFVPPKEYDSNIYLSHIHEFLTKGMGLKEEEIVYHEDVWAGGGNLGPSIEFFSKGLEIGNQVYMQYEIRGNELVPLKIQVLDMGMGQERIAWFSNGTSTSYDANFPSVMKMLYYTTGIKKDESVWQKFLPLSALLNRDEVKDIDKIWEFISTKIGVEKDLLKKEIEPTASLYVLAEHTRSLLFALVDGAIPSNVGGGYNLRVLCRRIFDILVKYEWNLDLYSLFEEHAKYLKKQYPELLEGIDIVKKIMEEEKKKYEKTQDKAKTLLKKYKGRKIDIDEMILLYDSHGISPQMLKQLNIINKVPENFYNLVAERHEKKVQKTQTTREKVFTDEELKDVPITSILYWDDWKKTNFEAKVVKVKGKYVILDKTLFYPTSGGQLHDTGELYVKDSSYRVIDVFKQDNYIVHVIDKEGIKEGEEIIGKIDFYRRYLLTLHHSAAHILNLASRKVLGDHVWQYGAEKTMEKGRLDITHYTSLKDEEIKKIEDEANKIIEMNLKVEKKIMERDKAERKYGFRIYQGGAPPGKKLRIVKIGEDVEACGGTHVNHTGELLFIKIISTSKIQDGVVRIEYVAGPKAREYVQYLQDILKEVCSTFSVPISSLSLTASKFFNEWKEQRKEIERLRQYKIEYIKDEILKNTYEKEGCVLSYVDLSNKKDVEIKDILQATSLLKDKRIDACLVRISSSYVLISMNERDAETFLDKFELQYKEKKGKGKLLILIS